jgi:hypothetical protein
VKLYHSGKHLEKTSKCQFKFFVSFVEKKSFLFSSLKTFFRWKRGLSEKKSIVIAGAGPLPLNAKFVSRLQHQPTFFILTKFNLKKLSSPQKSKMAAKVRFFNFY